MVRASLFTLPDDLCLAPAIHGAAAPTGIRWIAGEENLLARRAAESIRQEPLAYNPIVVFGPAGIGKTCYLQMLAKLSGIEGNELLFTSGADFARTFGRAHHQDSLPSFRTRLRRLRLLVIDELEGIAGKTPSQRELVATLDALTRRGALVLAALRQPITETNDLIPSLASRLSQGLSFPLLGPRRTTAQALVQYFAEQHGLALGEKWITRIAGQQTAGALPITPYQLRETIAAIARLAADSHREVDETLLERALQMQASAVRPKPTEIVSATARYYHLPVADLRGPSRRADLVRARSLAMYLIRNLSGASLQATGRVLGNRDHTTVLHALRKIESLSDTDPLMKKALADLTNTFSPANRKE